MDAVIGSQDYLEGVGAGLVIVGNVDPGHDQRVGVPEIPNLPAGSGVEVIPEGSQQVVGFTGVGYGIVAISSRGAGKTYPTVGADTHLTAEVVVVEVETKRHRYGLIVVVGHV